MSFSFCGPESFSAPPRVSNFERIDVGMRDVMTDICFRRGVMAGRQATIMERLNSMDTEERGFNLGFRRGCEEER